MYVRGEVNVVLHLAQHTERGLNAEWVGDHPSRCSHFMLLLNSPLLWRFKGKLRIAADIMILMTLCYFVYILREFVDDANVWCIIGCCTVNLIPTRVKCTIFLTWHLLCHYSGQHMRSRYNLHAVLFIWHHITLLSVLFYCWWFLVEVQCSFCFWLRSGCMLS